MLKSFTVIATLLSAGAAAAQDTGWTYRASLYGWLPAMSTSLDTRFGTLEGEVSAADVLSALDIAVMTSFSAQNGNWGLVGDLVYSDLSDSIDTPLPLFTSADIGMKMTAVSGYALYRLTNDQPVQFDVGAGFRHFDMALDVGLSQGLASGISADLAGDWTDPLIAARLMVPINDKWFLSGFADFGGTSAKDQTYQIYTGVGYTFNAAWSMQAGYRYMDITHTVKGRDFDIGLSGGLIGVTYSF